MLVINVHLDVEIQACQDRTMSDATLMPFAIETTRNYCVNALYSPEINPVALLIHFPHCNDAAINVWVPSLPYKHCGGSGNIIVL
jgi:hypothetical protein